MSGNDKIDAAAGKAKEMAGKVTGDDELANEGKVQDRVAEAKDSIKDAAGKAADAVKNAATGDEQNNHENQDNHDDQ